MQPTFGNLLLFFDIGCDCSLLINQKSWSLARGQRQSDSVKEIHKKWRRKEMQNRIAAIPLQWIPLAKKTQFHSQPDLRNLIWTVELWALYICRVHVCAAALIKYYAYAAWPTALATIKKTAMLTQTSQIIHRVFGCLNLCLPNISLTLLKKKKKNLNFVFLHFIALLLLA